MTAPATAAGAVPALAPPPVPQYAMLGIRVGAYDIPKLNACIASAVESGQRIVIANHNLHSVYLHGRDQKFRDFHAAADVCHADGMSLIALGRLLGVPLTKRDRVTYVDWIGPLMAEAVQRGWRVYSVGGKPGVFEAAAVRLRAEYPGLQLEGTHGYFDVAPGSADTKAVLARIAAYHPQVLIVGMGMPRQEHWVHDNRAALAASATLIAGAAMDYVAGVVPTPPRGAAAAGFEWLWRFAAEPRRLWRRYLIEPWYVMGLVLAAWVRRRLGGDA